MKDGFHNVEYPRTFNISKKHGKIQDIKTKNGLADATPFFKIKSFHFMSTARLAVFLGAKICGSFPHPCEFV